MSELSETKQISIIVAQWWSIRFSISFSTLKPQCIKGDWCRPNFAVFDLCKIYGRGDEMYEWIFRVPPTVKLLVYFWLSAIWEITVWVSKKERTEAKDTDTHHTALIIFLWKFISSHITDKYATAQKPLQKLTLKIFYMSQTTTMKVQLQKCEDVRKNTKIHCITAPPPSWCWSTGDCSRTTLAPDSTSRSWSIRSWRSIIVSAAAHASKMEKNTSFVLSI